MTDAREVRALLEDRPNLEPALESLLETDGNHDTWTFDDTGLDSGAFGELVSEGVVEKVDGEYRLADADAVERALAGEVEAGGADLSLSLPSVDVDRRVAGALAGALVLVFAFRVLTLEAVYRDGRVVLSGNDPYYYLYLVEELTRVANGPLDVAALTGAPVPTGGEPLLVAVLWLATALSGGIEAAPAVLAWYPVVAGVTSGLFVYWLATGLTDDRRVGIAAVVMLAVMPVLSFRSGLGFADHHAFDYVWLTLTAAGAVRLARVPATRAAVTDRGTLGWAGVTGLAIASQLAAWEAGPLLLFPLALLVPLAALLALDDGTSVPLRLAPFAAAFGVAAVGSVGVHLALNWQSTAGAFTPVLLLGGTVGVAALGEAVDRAPTLPTSPVRTLAALELVAAGVAYLLLMTVLSSFGTVLFDRLEQVATDDSIVEAASLFATSTFGWLFLFGLLLFLAIPYAGFAFVRAARGEDGHRWLLAGLYTAVFLLLASLQMRFAGELAPFVAVFSGLGFVHIAERVDLARPPAPFRTTASVRGDGGGPREESDSASLELPGARQVAAIVFLFLLLAGLNVVQAPAKANQVVITESTYETATWIENDAAQRELTYPENYVLSEWGRNRVYNYFVNGESRGYGYAFRTYDDFLGGTDMGRWYDRLHDRVGYVVVSDADSPESSIHRRLSRAGGSRYQGHPGSGHFRLVAVPGNQVYRLVSGANVTGEAPANTTVQVETELSVSGVRFTYTRRANVTAAGTYRTLVAYPGDYTVTQVEGNATTSVTVPESAVENGDRVDAGSLRADGATNALAGQSRLARPFVRPHRVSPS
jgi:dolichyl-diphosphooligosaccharide--protein glycosyltransferase